MFNLHEVMKIPVGKASTTFGKLSKWFGTTQN
jgi:hypothetical protein